MNRLEEIKNEYALFNNYPNWDEFISDTPIFRREEHYDEIGKIYAEECVKASLEKASKNTEMHYHDGYFKTNTPKNYVQIGSDNVQINKDSIINPENIILL